MDRYYGGRVEATGFKVADAAVAGSATADQAAAFIGARVEEQRPRVAVDAAHGLDGREELDALAETHIRDNGGVPNFQLVPGYRHTLCTSVNDAVLHGLPFDYTLQDGDLVDNWGETTILRSVDDVAALKETDGAPISIHGSASLARGLAAHQQVHRLGDLRGRLQQLDGAVIALHDLHWLDWVPALFDALLHALDVDGGTLGRHEVEVGPVARRLQPLREKQLRPPEIGVRQPIVRGPGDRAGLLDRRDRRIDDQRLGYQNNILYVMDRDGSNRRALTETLDRSVGAPVWSADGRALYVVYDERGGTRVARVGLDGTVRTVAEGLSGSDLDRPYSGGSFSVARNGTIAVTSGTATRPAGRRPAGARQRGARATPRRPRGGNPAGARRAPRARAP